MLNHRDVDAVQGALLIDPSVVGQSHLLVNTGIVRLAVARHTHVTVLAEISHCVALKQYLDAQIINQVTFISWQRKSEIIGIIRKLIAHTHFKYIIFTNIEYYLFVYMGFFHRNTSKNPILWMFHSHLVNSASPKKIARAKNFVKWFFLFKAFHNVRFIVLGGRIRANIETLIGPFFRKRNITSIIHPVGVASLPDSSITAPKYRTQLPRIIFMSGWHSLTPENRRLLDKFELIDPSLRRFELSIVGNNLENSREKKTFAMEYTDRLNLISKSDFFLHLPSDSYHLQASGAVMDMLLTHTPIIGLRTDFGDEMIELIGQFGYFFDTHDDLLNFLSFAVIDFAEVRQFRANLAAGYGKIMTLSQAQFDAAVAS